MRDSPALYFKKIPTLFISFFLIIFAYFSYLELHIQLLGGESGILLELSASGSQGLQDFLRIFFWKSYNGHYTPLVFLAEFIQSKIYGTNESLWFFRQVFVLGLFATSIFFVAHTALINKCNKSITNILSLSVTLIFTFQPAIIELTSWPFMSFQLLTLTIMGIATILLIKYTQTSEILNLYGYLGFSYISMHFSGTGFAISVGAIVTAISIVVLKSKADSIENVVFRKAVFAISVSLIFTCLHAYIMTKDAQKPSPIGAPLTILESLVRYGSLLADSCYAGIKAIWANGGFNWPRTNVSSMQSVYGWASGITLLILLQRIAKSFLQTKTAIYLTGYALVAFPAAVFACYLGLIVVRLQEVNLDDAVLPYLIGTRYVIFPCYFLYMMGIGGVIPVLIRLLGGGSVAAISCVLAVAAIIANTVFFLNVLPSLWPYLLVNNETQWNEAVAQAKVDITNSGYVTNRSLPALGLGIKIDLQSMHFLLEKSMGCTACVKFSER